MIKYLLLRDNKQSGPYSCDELRQKGLKAYDLVWAEGKSAAWRYPSEVEELRSFAPVVEEQPFDRFYKKPGQQTATVNTAPQSRPVNERDTVTETPAAAGKRIIYVTLPAGRNPAANSSRSLSSAPAERQASMYNNQAYIQSRPSILPAANDSTQEERSSVSRDFPVYKGIAGKTTSQDVLLEEGQLSSIPGLPADPAEENLSQPLKGGRAAVELNPRQKGKSGARVMQLLLVSVCILALLAAGVFIGMSLSKNLPGLAQKSVPPVVPPVSHKEQAVAPASQNPVAAMSVSVPSDSLAKNNSEPEKTVANTGTEQQKMLVTSAVHVKDKAPGNAAKQQTPAVNTAGKDSAVAAYAVVHREASHRTDMAVEKMDKDLVRNNLSNLVSIGASHYSVGAFGGISDLQLTVSNRSVYPLDLVVVEVQYIQANKKVFKTENLYFRGIGAGSALMQEAPKSTRGIKVQYKITLVNSKELGLSYSAL